MFLIESGSEKPEDAYTTLIGELDRYDSTLLLKPRIIVLTKVDLLTEEDRKGLPKRIEGQECLFISCVTREGLPELKNRLAQLLEMNKHV